NCPDGATPRFGRADLRFARPCGRPEYPAWLPAIAGARCPNPPGTRPGGTRIHVHEPPHLRRPGIGPAAVHRPASGPSRVLAEVSQPRRATRPGVPSVWSRPGGMFDRPAVGAIALRLAQSTPGGGSAYCPAPTDDEGRSMSFL